MSVGLAAGGEPPSRFGGDDRSDPRRNRRVVTALVTLINFNVPLLKDGRAVGDLIISHGCMGAPIRGSAYGRTRRITARSRLADESRRILAALT